MHRVAELQSSCEVCGEPASTFELAALVRDGGELVETPVVAIRDYCGECRTLLLAHSWEGLQSRSSGLSRTG